MIGIDIPIRMGQQVATMFPLAVIIILAGIVLVVAGLIMMATKRTYDSETRHESKGVVLIGPLPVVWGFGAKAQSIAMVIAFLVFALFLMSVLM
jgi:uncharacterized protein (TIGR00304 family)